MRRGLKKALLGPINVGVAGVAAACAAALHSLPLLAVGGAAYAALVAWDLSSESFWRQIVRGPADPPALPAPGAMTDPEIRAVLERVLGARVQVRETVASSPAPLSTPLAGALATLDELDARIARLVIHGDDLARYLAKSDPQPVRAELARLGDRAARALDPETRRHYDEARALREQQLRTIDEIAAARERVLANLSRIVAALEAIPPRLVKMRALDAQAAEGLSDDVGRELAEMNVELGAFEETLQSLTEAGGGAGPARGAGT